MSINYSPLPPLKVQQPLKESKYVRAITTVFIILASAVLVAILYSHAASSSCTVGVTGTAANVTFVGGSSQSDCSSMVNGNNQKYYSNGTPEYYQYNGDPSGTEVCSGLFGSDAYVVRDTGLFMMAGGQLCQEFRSSQ